MLSKSALLTFCATIAASLSFTATASATQSFAIIGDAGLWNGNTESVRDSIRRNKVTQLVLPGDNVYWGTYDQQWKAWTGFDFSVVAIGNHNNGYKREIDYFKMSGEYFSKTFADGVRFLVLNSDNDRNVEEQRVWLEKELEKDSPMTFVVWHHPPYTVTSLHRWEEKYKFQVAMRSILKRYENKITALLVGHDHIGAFYCLDKMPMIVSGAVQETRFPETKNYQANDKVNVNAKWVFPFNTPVWARLDIEPNSEKFSVKFIRASDDKVLFSSELSENPRKNICQN